MKLIKAADPDSALKSELRETWIIQSPSYKQALSAYESAATEAASVPWNPNGLTYVQAVKKARAAKTAAREALDAARVALESEYDAAVRLPDIDLEQVPGYKPFPPTDLPPKDTSADPAKPVTPV